MHLTEDVSPATTASPSADSTANSTTNSTTNTTSTASGCDQDIVCLCLDVSGSMSVSLRL